MSKSKRSGLSALPSVLFVAAVFLFLTAGLIKAVFFEEEVNLYENRTADKLAPFSLSAFLSGSYQDSMEKGLADQLPLAQDMKKSYNDSHSSILQSMMLSLIENTENRYISYLGKSIFNKEYLLYAPDKYGGAEDLRFDRNLASYNAVFAANPDTEFFVYYIECDRDINFETGEKSGIYEHFVDTLHLPEGHIRRFRVDSFDGFRRHFMKTDHHWNCAGSYQGYKDILEMIAPSQTPLPILEEVTLGRGVGSKAAGISGFSEDFNVYRFDFPKMKISYFGRSQKNYGAQESYLARVRENGRIPDEENIRYGDFYGWDNAELLFETDRADGENLLILGDSFDNAILKLLASHFKRTYSIDPRHYERITGSPLHMTEYIKEHDIDKVVLEGYQISFLLETFAWEN